MIVNFLLQCIIAHEAHRYNLFSKNTFFLDSISCIKYPKTGRYNTKRVYNCDCINPMPSKKRFCLASGRRNETSKHA
jgi:hypothetical protein